MEQIKVIIYSILLLLSILLSACTTYSSWIRSPQVSNKITTRVDFIDWADILVDQLSHNLLPKKFSDYPCIVTTVVDINDLEHTCPFSRELTEALRTSLFKHRAKVIELMAAKCLLVSPKKGTLYLSRNANLITSAVKARAILVGTYLVGANTVTVNLRLIGAKTHKIISAAILSIDKSAAVEKLLRDNSSLNTSGYENLPID